ncbi:hypothetical protein HZH68_000444 [Vespula germanica]|uniref:Ribosomal protein mS38 C-terminal domain-containing protein n=1 Tax=Vespula germanica TaxID=30212 RepID=A0A834NTM1_VESGE|nr:hypothetical protein HZH68_000444 [Vespula germanica]
MTLNMLCTAFRRLAINPRGTFPVRCYFKHEAILNKEKNIIPLYRNNNGDICKTNLYFNIKFAPRTLNIDFELPMNNDIYKSIIDIPITGISKIENPNRYLPIHHELPVPNKSMELPTIENTIEKQAVRLIVIRRRKMKKHQRRKLRKKMKFYWRKIKQRRELLKEKAFQAEQVTLIKQAESFDPVKYVNERLQELDKEYIPKTYRGEVLPQEMIKKFIEDKKRKKEARNNIPKLTL